MAVSLPKKKLKSFDGVDSEPDLLLIFIYLCFVFMSATKG